MKQYTFIILLLLLSFFSSAQLAQIDSSYGVNGLSIVNLGGFDWEGDDKIQLQPDGKILCVATEYTGGGVQLARFLPDGQLDIHFGDSGYFALSPPNTIIKAMALDTLGRILLAGFKDAEIFLLRIKHNGYLDQSFGQSGKVTLNLFDSSASGGQGIFVNEVIVQGDHKIIVTGTIARSCFSGIDDYWCGYSNFFAARFYPNGTLDSSFNGKGYNDSLGDGSFLKRAWTSVLQNDGKLLIGGGTGLFGDGAMYLVRADTSGSMDSSFGKDGVVVGSILSGHYSEAIYDIELQIGNKIIVSGHDVNGSASVNRLHSNGNLDSSFGVAGVRSISGSALFHNHIALCTLWDGKIIASSGDVVTIMDSNGNIDTLCGQGSFVLDSIPSSAIKGNGDAAPNPISDLVANPTNNELYILSSFAPLSTRYHLNTNAVHETLTICDSTYTINGNSYSSTGEYLDTLTSVQGCDSVVWSTLSFVEPSYDSITASVCEFFVSPKGRVLTQSGIYTDTLTNEAGCDSIINISLEVLEDLSMFHVNACSYYTSPSGNLWTESGSYLDTLQNRFGCDSILAITLNIIEPSSSFDTITTCNSFTSASGKLWTQSGVYLDTIANTNGCDSMLTIDLTVLKPSNALLSINSCEAWISPTGKTYVQSGTYQDTLLNTQGCDSIVSIDLTINYVEVGVVQLHQQLVSKADGAEYQWLDCEDDFSKIDGQTHQFLEPQLNGVYAVEVSKNNCVDTSECYLINTLGLHELSTEELSIYPNPTTGFITVELGDITEVVLTISDSKGNTIHETTALKGNYQYELKGAAGIYILTIRSKDLYKVYRILKY